MSPPRDTEHDSNHVYLNEVSKVGQRLVKGWSKVGQRLVKGWPKADGTQKAPTLICDI